MPLSEEYLKSVSESKLKDRAYMPYELEKYERDSLEEIKKTVKNEGYTKKEDIQDSLDFLEKLANKINMAVTNEKKDNKTTWELETDLNDLKKLFEKLNQMLQVIESQEVETISKKILRKTKK